ncbi:hypothetical protein MTO96_034592 [Rhipicephalus appendiculatus]
MNAAVSLGCPNRHLPPPSLSAIFLLSILWRPTSRLSFLHGMLNAFSSLQARPQERSEICLLKRPPRRFLGESEVNTNKARDGTAYKATVGLRSV